jgi:hypothetical protein
MGIYVSPAMGIRSIPRWGCCGLHSRPSAQFACCGAGDFLPAVARNRPGCRAASARSADQSLIMTIVHTDYRPQRARKRKHSPPIPQRIVSAKPPKPGKATAAIAEKPRAQPAAITGQRIVTARKPRPKHDIGPEQIAAARDAAPADPPPAIRKSAIVTARSPKAGRFGLVQDIDPEEHQRRGDAAVELFRELVRRAAWNAR